MCGIVGYTGTSSALEKIIEGLRRLEYRGYDSAGIALGQELGQSLFVAKRAGKLSQLVDALPNTPSNAKSGIGHTRWATHGGPTDANAHPHTDQSGKLAVIHNGIIENYLELRAELESRGHKFQSETDTESVAHLLAEEYNDSGNLTISLRRVCKRLRGSFTLLAIHADEPSRIVGARRNSPLVIGVGAGENFLASDVSAFISCTKQALELGQDQVVEITPTSVTVSELDGTPVTPHAFEITWDAKAAERGGFEHFMLKEIFEQPSSVMSTLRGRIAESGEVELTELAGLDFDRVLILGCGSAYHAGLIGKYVIEDWAKLQVDVELASEFRYRNPVVLPRTLVLTISQSGETMDTLMALRYVKSRGAKSVAICNTVGSSIVRESDAFFNTNAGPEIAVASTKALLTQVVALQLIAMSIATTRKSLAETERRELVRGLLELPSQMESILETVEPIRALTRRFKSAETVLFLGRNLGYPTALEGALKLKELAYIHAEGFAGGELKHGPIALVENRTLVIAIMPPLKSKLALKMMSNIQEVRARGASVIAITELGHEIDTADVIRIPTTYETLQPVLALIPLQVFAYEMALARGNDVDQPRNLAKSVTVE